MTKRRHYWGHYLTSGLWVMSVPQREKGWHHSRVIILFGWAPIESSHYARGGLLSENHVTFWYSASCTQLENAYSPLHAMCGCVKKDQVVFVGQYYCFWGDPVARFWLSLVFTEHRSYLVKRHHFGRWCKLGHATDQPPSRDTLIND